jgi:hypothetical protein
MTKANRNKKKRVALVVHQGGAGRGDAPFVDQDPGVEVCGVCQGPAFLCRLDHDHDQEALAERSAIERRWLAALRAVHVGVALCSTPAAGMGGALLVLGRRLVSGTAMPEPDALMQAAADPKCMLPGTVATTYALAALVEHEARWSRPSRRAARVLGRQSATILDVLQALAGALRDARARWIRETVALATEAALASPFVVRETFPLVAIVCRSCAGAGAAGGVAVAWESFVRPAELYDNALRCPGCQRLHVHPLPFSAMSPRLPWPALHPVGRCQRGERAAGIGCVTHDLPMSADALCEKGRHLHRRAQAHIAVRMGEKTALEPWESRVLIALVLAGQRERARRAAGGATDPQPARSLADELAEALAQMRHDMQKSLPLLARILPAPLLSVLGLLGGAASLHSVRPRNRDARGRADPGVMTTGRRFNLGAVCGDDVVEYPNVGKDEAERIERDLLADGWTVMRTPGRRRK